MHPTYHRCCWHVVCRCLFARLTQLDCSLAKGVYNPKAFIPHATSLDQAFAHCRRFPVAATRRCMDRVSVPFWGAMLSHPLPVIVLVGFYPTNKLIGRRLILKRRVSSFKLSFTCGISSSFEEVSRTLRQIPTRSSAVRR